MKILSYYVISNSKGVNRAWLVNDVCQKRFRCPLLVLLSLGLHWESHFLNRIVFTLLTESMWLSFTDWWSCYYYIQEDTAEYGGDIHDDKQGIQRVVDELLEKVQRQTQSPLQLSPILEAFRFVPTVERIASHLDLNSRDRFVFNNVVWSNSLHGQKTYEIQSIYLSNAWY